MIKLKNIFSAKSLRIAIMFAIAFSMIASIGSYTPSDPAFNVTSYGVSENLLSYFGSYIADLILQLFGLSGLLIPLFLLLWARCLWKKDIISFLYLRIFFAIICVISTASLAKLSGFENKILPVGYSGILGQLTNYVLKENQQYLPSDSWQIFILSSISIISFVISSAISFKSYGIFTSKASGLLRSLITKLNLARFLPNSSKTNAYFAENEFANFSNPRKKSQANDYKSPVEVNKAQVKSLSTNKIPNDFEGERIIPPLDLLHDPKNQGLKKETKAELEERSGKLIEVLKDFGVNGKIVDIQQGPVVTMYEFEPSAGTKSSRVIGLTDDIARSLSATSTRISVIPGRNALGIELPNQKREFFCLKELITTEEFRNPNISLPLILGKDLGGSPLVADLAKMPHLLVAGTTGSGKSVAINAMIMSLLYRYSPEECRMIMIDPKMLELSAYHNIPHLMTPVVTEPGKAIVALKWAVKEMENRYRLMSQLGVRNITNFNNKIKQALANGEILERQIQTGFDPDTGKPMQEKVKIDMKKMPFIVVIVDEMADLMLVAGKDIEASIQRLAQMARAAGIHIIMATQRPSVDIITGVIKANFPSRISFKVTSKIDSRTILGQQGSEQLLGMGDMLYMGNSSKILRVHGPFVDDSEVANVTNYLRSCGFPDYISAVIESNEDDSIVDLTSSGSSEEEDLYSKAIDIVKRERKSSISYIQRSLRIGYNRSANLVEEMEKNGVLSPPNHSGKREILIPEE